jgi:hypothetical protein
MPILQLNGQNLQLNGLDLYLNGLDADHNLSATSVSAQSSVSNPALTQSQVLLANDITAASSVSTPALNGVVGGVDDDGVIVGSGHWRGKGGGKKKRTYEGQPQRIRKLSELDPPLFTPQEVIEPAHKPIVLDRETVARIQAAAITSAATIGEVARKIAVARQIQDEDELMLML